MNLEWKRTVAGYGEVTEVLAAVPLQQGLTRSSTPCACGSFGSSIESLIE